MLIENAPGSGDTPVSGSGAAVRACARTSAGAPVVLYTGTFEAVPGAGPAVRRRGARPGRPARRSRSCWPAAGPSRSQRRAGRRRARGVGGIGDLRRPAAGRGDSRLPRCRRRARFAAQHRHQHSAQDLSVPAIRLADRGDAPAHAYPGARRRGGIPDGTDRRRVRRRHPRRRSPIRSRARAVGARARQLAETKYSYESYLDPHACWPARTSPARSPPQVAGGRRREPAPAERPLQLLGLRRPGDGRGVRRAAVQRSDRPADRRDAGAGRRRAFWRRSKGARCSTSAPAPGGRRSPWRGAARSSPASTRRRRCWRWPAGGPRDRRWT